MRIHAPLLGFLIALAGTSAYGQATQVGTTAIANNQVRGTLGDQRRSLGVGDNVFQDEEISTGDAAQAQILFLDETTLNIGPNSRVALTRLVYDPEQGTGEVVLNAVSGSFRFVTGSSPSENYRVETPLGTIGVRGTILAFQLGANFLRVETTSGASVLCISPDRCVPLRAGTYTVTDGQRLGGVQSTSSAGCGSSGSYAAAGGRTYCSTFDETGLRTYIQAIQPPPPPPPSQPVIINPPG